MFYAPPQVFYDRLVQRCIFQAKKSINGYIIANFSLGHGDMKKISLDKIVDIILELPDQKFVLLFPAGILR